MSEPFSPGGGPLDSAPESQLDDAATRAVDNEAPNDVLYGQEQPASENEALKPVGDATVRFVQSHIGSNEQDGGQRVEGVAVRSSGNGCYIGVSLSGPNGERERQDFLLCRIRKEGKKDEKTGPAYRLVSLADLRTFDLPPPRQLVIGLIRVGETVLIVGRPKVGKSRLTLYLAICLTRGEEFLGLHVAGPLRVLILDLENRLAGVRERAMKMAQAAEGDERLFIYAPDTLADAGIDATKTGIARLEAGIALCQADVLIVDTWRLFAGGDENKSENTVEALKALSSLRRLRPGLTIILVHHLRKDRQEASVRLLEDPNTWVESVSGHHALVSHVDACYGVERFRDSGGDERIVFGGVARNHDSMVLMLEDDEDTLRFALASGEEALLASLTPKQREYWECAKELRRFTHAEIMRAANVRSGKTLTGMLRKAENHGALAKEGDCYVALC